MKTEPRIVCFMCNWAFCQNEIAPPQNMSIARITCLGRVDPVIVLEAFEKGVDGVMLVGCKPPDCHYQEGNLQGERAAKIITKLIALANLGPERVKLLWFSPAEGKKFESLAKEFEKEIEKIGPSPVKDQNANLMCKINVSAAKNAASDFRLRVLLGREKELTEGVNVYGEKLSEEEFDALMNAIVEEEFVRHKIHILTRTKPLSVKELAEAVEMTPATVLRQIVDMRRKNMIALDHISGQTPFYKALEAE